MSKKVKDETLLSALLTSSSIREASRICGLSESQIYERMRNPEFAKRYRDSRRELLTGCMAGLQASLGEAVNVISQIMRNEEVSPQIRLNACESILRNSMKLTEQIDIMERLEAIERARGMHE